jgi:hypothetical protein
VASECTGFLLIVLSILKQIRDKKEPISNDWNEGGFNRAFSFDTVDGLAPNMK